MNIRRNGKRFEMRFALLIMSVFVLALAGCAAQSGATQPGTPAATTAPSVGTQAAPTVEPTVEAMATEPATAMPEATAAMTTTVTGPATVMISSNDELGDILSDDKGMTLYLFTKDTPNTSNCYDQCATNWPPLLTEGEPAAGTGADAALLGTTERTDGTTQVTYNGWPLYYWVKDQEPGDATGQDVGGVWYVLNAKGEQVETPSESSAAPAAVEAKTVNISIKNFSFGETLTVPVGTTVVWTNEDSMDHTVTASDNSFDSGTFGQGDTFSFTFTEAGSFDYICALHPNMKGNVTVTG